MPSSAAAAAAMPPPPPLLLRRRRWGWRCAAPVLWGSATRGGRVVLWLATGRLLQLSTERGQAATTSFLIRHACVARTSMRVIGARLRAAEKLVGQHDSGAGRMSTTCPAALPQPPIDFAGCGSSLHGPSDDFLQPLGRASRAAG